jgi:hypothetical protein
LCKQGLTMSFIRRLTFAETKYRFIDIASGIQKIFPSVGNQIVLESNGVQCTVKIDNYGRIWVGRLLAKADITLVPGISAKFVRKADRNFFVSFSI